MGEATNTSPHVDKSFNNPPCMDQGPNDSTHIDEGVNKLPQTDHDDIEDGAQFEDCSSEDWSSEDWSSEDDHKHSYWMKEYAGHVWDDDRGWLVLKPGSPPEPWWIEDPPSRSPLDPDYLCDVCRHINFCWLFGNKMAKSTSSKEMMISIGTLESVSKRVNCSFCAFVASSWFKHTSVYISRRYLSETSWLDLNHPETEVKYLSIGTCGKWERIQVLDNSRPMRGRQISPYIKQQQQNIARHWLEKCEHEHCSSEDADLVPDLALIDLNQRCIVRPHGPVRYATLSYVWGKSRQRMYSTSTRQEFETNGALRSKQGFLPQTITDAMDLAAHIGLDYLWVDSLCILQDYEENRNYFISKMGSIYGASAVTIVDANGDHADSGLVGMSSPRANCQKIATVQGMQLCTIVGSFDTPWDDYSTCPWFKRGWTYQEMLLSKRLLLVTHAQLQFVCNHTVYLEEIHPHSPRTSDWALPASTGMPLRRSETAGTPISHLYQTAVEKFTERNLTHEMDIIPAFDAIFKDLYKNTMAKSLFNLPDVEIEEALVLWESISYDKPFTVDSLSKKARRRQPDQLPSWSWAGWKGRIKYNEWDRVAPLISVVLWRCAPISVVDKRSEFPIQDYRCANWRERQWNSRFLPDWRTYIYTHDSRPNVFFRNPIALEPHDAGLHKQSLLDDSNVLHFSAFTIPISASTRKTGVRLDDRGEFGNTRHILDSSGYRAGSIRLDSLPANEVGLRLVALARCKNRSAMDFMPAGLKNIAPLDWDPNYFKNISPPNDVDKRHAEDRSSDDWDHRRFRGKFYPLYKALLVEMSEGIAYRIGVGEVHIDAFHAANPTWEEVRLG